MKELLTALINSNNESGKHIHYLYRKYCKLLYGIDYGYKIYDSEELFTDFIKYIFDMDITTSYYSTATVFKFQNKNRGMYYEEYIHKGNSSNSIMSSLRRLLTYFRLEQIKDSNLNTLKNAKIH